MEKLNMLLDKSIGSDLISCILSGKRNKLGDTDKLKIRQVILKDRHMLQVTEYAGTKVFHQNLDASSARKYVMDKLLTEFKQCQIQCREHAATVLVSSKGKFTIKEKGAKLTIDDSALMHNRTKEYLLPEGTAVPFLVDLGVMTPDGRVVKAKYDKFRQINRFLEFIRDVLPSLEKNRELTVLDFGCGKSYLTFAMYYYLKELMGYDINVTGLDLKADVIEDCNRLALKYGYDKLHFLCGDVADYDGITHADMVVTLHACDTATDYALFKAVKWGASVILSVPCCQHEFNKTISNDTLAPVFSFGIIKERTAALMTDGLRGCLLNAAGYDTQILEFIDMEHTPKNLLIRATKKQKGSDSRSLSECINIMRELNVDSTLYRLLFENEGRSVNNENH